jgi:predicted nucleotidyltransferase
MSSIIPLPPAVYSFRNSPYCTDPRGNRRVERDLTLVARDLERRLGSSLATVLLVGSYARGEGGVVMRAGEVFPHNDYDLLVVLRDRRSTNRWIVAERAKHWSRQLGVEVDMWPLHVDVLGRLPRTLFWFDVVLGGSTVLAGELPQGHEWPSWSTRDIPLDEAGRLLANRATGLALSNLEGPSRDPLRAMRHIHKAVQACADVRLLAADCYGTTLAARATQMRKLAAGPGMGELAQAYDDALRFRVRPDLWRPPADVDFDAWYRARLRDIEHWHMSFEAARTGCPRDVLLAAQWRESMHAGAADIHPVTTPFSTLRAAVAQRAAPWPYFGHPRERLTRVAMLLAYFPNDARARLVASRLLAGRPSLEQAFANDELHKRLLALVPYGS